MAQCGRQLEFGSGGSQREVFVASNKELQIFGLKAAAKNNAAKK